MTYFAYIDESGDAGAAGSGTYVLACVLVHTDRWSQTFDALISYRRWLRTTFGVPVRAEIKANYLLHNGGPFRPLALSESARFHIYRQTMRLMPKLGLQVFAVLIRKGELATQRPLVDPRETCWEYTLQRLERFMTRNHAPLLLIHDEGEHLIVRKLARKARRAGTAGSRFGIGRLNVPAQQLLDDPVPRDSKQSYFLQLADLAAFAAYRRMYPPPPRLVNIVSSGTWDEMGAARLAPANYLSGGPMGLVAFPRAP